MMFLFCFWYALMGASTAYMMNRVASATAWFWFIVIASWPVMAILSALVIYLINSDVDGDE